ncbi:MAG: sulfatase-like hydrolase/transferase [Thermodesulfobacteriota bacterium]
MALAVAGCSRGSPPAPPPELATALRFVEDGLLPSSDERLETGAPRTLDEVSHPVLTAAKPFRPALSCTPETPGGPPPVCEATAPRTLPDAPATILAWSPPGRSELDVDALAGAAATTPDPARDVSPAAEEPSSLAPAQTVVSRLVPPPPGARVEPLGQLEAYFAKLYRVPPLDERTIQSRHFEVPPDAVLRLSYGVEESAWWIDSAPVEFRIVVERASGEQSVLRRTLDPARREEHRRWFEVDVDLSDLAGERVRLRFLTAPAEDGDARPSLPVWGDPRLLGRSSEARRPSIVLVSLDTLRAKSMSAYGHALETTPAIAAFARRGALFENAFTTYSNTLPSHMSMLTGLLPVEHGVLMPNDVLGERHATLAETLRRAGWATAAFTEDALLDSRRGFYRGFSTYYENTRVAVGAGDADGTFGRALEWAGRHADEPFFLFVHTYEVHQPYHPHRAYRGLFHDGAGAGMDDRQRAYEQEIRYLDDQLRRLLDGLYGIVPERDLLVVVTADHGEEFGEHGALAHVQLFDEVMRVPLVMVWAGVIPPGLRIAAPVSLVDLPPTVLDLADVPLDNDVDGTSLVPLLSEQPAPRSHDVVLAEYPRSVGLREPGFVARSASVKCIVTENGEQDACYDLEADPAEKQPRPPHEKPEFARVHAGAKDYRARALAARVPRDDAHAAHPQATSEPDHRIQRKLRALGYIQ